jgi:hypothetical protein
MNEPKSTLRQAIEKTQDQLATDKEQILPASKVVVVGPARSYPSATAAYEDGTQFDSEIVGIHTTVRPMWRTPDVAIQQNKVITTNLPPAVTASGLIVSPSVTSAVLVGIPDMSAAVRVPAGSQVQVSWQFSGSLSASTASASFALYRDTVRIGPVLYGNSPANNAKFSMSQTFIDTPSPGLHAYSVYWATSAGTLTGDGKGRVLHALVLKPQ